MSFVMRYCFMDWLTFSRTLKDAVQAHEGDLSDSDSGSENEMIAVPADEKPKEKWDCESILSKIECTVA